MKSFLETFTCTPESTCNVLFAVHGGFSLWSAWRSCSVTCGKGIQKRSRLCNNPPPANGGRPCQGSDSEARHCQNKLCPGTFQCVGRCLIDTNLCSLFGACLGVSTCHLTLANRVMVLLPCSGWSLVRMEFLGRMLKKLWAWQPN